MLADFLEAVGAVEQHRDVVARLQEHLAAQQRRANLGEALHVGVEHATQARAAARTGHDHAVDVQERGIALAEPEVVAALVRTLLIEGDQESGEMTIDFGDPEIGRVVVEETSLGGVHREDGLARGVIQGKDGIQLVLAHVADRDRHSALRRNKAGSRWPAPERGKLSHEAGGGVD